MANLKVALDYFPHIQPTRSMEMIGAEFQEKGYAIMWNIFEEIFMRGNGYFCEWNEDVALMFMQLPCISVGVNAVSEVLNAMFRRGILSIDRYKKYGILTSKYTQEVYFEAVKRRKNVTAIKEYLLINADKIPDNVNIISLNANINLKNVNINSQKKGKETKRKENKENNTSTSVDGRNAFDYQSVVNSFNSICVSLPKVQNLTETRRKKIKNASKILGNLSFEDVFNMVENSDFLTGRTDKWNGCSFDWILNTTNLTKIIEGNYNNKRPKQQSTSSYDINELEKFNALNDIEV